MSTPKEHSGGEPDYAFSVDEWTEESFAVPIHYDPAPIESIDDVCRQIIKDGGSVKLAVMKCADDMAMIKATRMLAYVMAIAVNSSNCQLMLEAVLLAVGKSDKSGTEIATRHAVSKQHVEQTVEKLRDKLGLRKTRNMRDADARATMARTNHRNTKSPLPFGTTDTKS